MKNYKYYGLTVLLFLTLTNCEDLEYDETSFNRKETVFNEFARSKSFVTGIYAYLPTDFNSVDGAMRATASDEAEHVADISDVQRFNDGSWSAVQPLDNVWNSMYAGIRASNLFLQESATQKFEELQFNDNYREIMQEYNNYPNEVKFLRAFFYFELAKRYKDVPLITTVLTVEEAPNVKEATFNEIVDFIVKECDEIAPKLPLTYVGFSATQETGRITRGAALALKARVLLYAASPLHNTDNNILLWQQAAIAARAVISLNTYSLAPTYAAVVNTLAANPGPELILERREGPSNGFERRNFPIGYEGGGSGTCPTQNLVDAYEMRISGQPITASNSNYNPQLPYNGRDSRLAQTVILNGLTWKNVTVQTFFGGRNGLPLTNATRTGYYLRKYVVESINLDPKLGQITTREKSWTLFRYAEILLNYAEAMNEGYGPQVPPPGGGPTAFDAVNLVRRRANGPSFNFPTGMTRDAFRIKLRNERRVELAFEDHRFWDIRRWKIGTETQNINAMSITRNPTTLALNYEVKLLEVRPWADRMYFYPKPQAEVFKSNNNIKQNIGW